MQMIHKYTYLYLVQTRIFPLNNLVTLSSLYVHPDNAASLQIYFLRTSLVTASHYESLYIILVLHLIAILILENMFNWHIAPASIISVTYAIVGAIFIFQSPTQLLQLSLLVGLIITTLFLITLYLRTFWNFTMYSELLS